MVVRVYCACSLVTVYGGPLPVLAGHIPRETAQSVCLVFGREVSMQDSPPALQRSVSPPADFSAAGCATGLKDDSVSKLGPDLANSPVAWFELAR